MKNWLGQDIVPDAVVYRGAREGDSSSFRIGRVVKVNEDTNKVTVEWLYEPLHTGNMESSLQKRIAVNLKRYTTYSSKNTSTCNLESIVLAPVVVEELEYIAEHNQHILDKQQKINEDKWRERQQQNLTRRY